MKKFKGINFDAVEIEYAFARILGRQIGLRGGPNDADVFRHGDIKSLGKLLKKTADAIENRVKNLSFTSQDSEPGKCKTIIDISIKSLRNIADVMVKEDDREPDQYHWIIIGRLLNIINGLLEKHGA